MTPSVQEVYERLLASYGPQGWWPGDGPFETIVGAILTQNTAWSNVEKALQAMRDAEVWSFEALHRTQERRLATLIRPSGYFNQKARKLKVFAEYVERDFAGDLDALLQGPDLRERLLGLWGIGEETADDIVLYAAGRPSFVIDRYTVRLAERIGWPVDGGSYRDHQRFFETGMEADADLWGEYHALIDRHAKERCGTTPVCEACCLAEVCAVGLSRVQRAGP